MRNHFLLLTLRSTHLARRSREGDELSAAARLARSEKRVFSDSEIYSPVFPRGRPPGELEKGAGGAAPADVSARVRAMKKGGNSRA